MATACCAGAVWTRPPATVLGEVQLYRVSIWNDRMVDRDLDTSNKSDTQGSVVHSDRNLCLLAGSRAMTAAWLFSAVLFPFCLAGSQEEQGLECEPFEGGLRPPLLQSFCWCGAGRHCLPWGGGLRTYLVHWWQVASLYLEQS